MPDSPLHVIPGSDPESPGRPEKGERSTLQKRIRFFRVWVIAAAVTALAITIGGYFSAHDPKITPMPLRADNLPSAFSEYQIALITDIHLGAGISGEDVRKIVERTNAANPDLVVIAGDLTDGTVAQLGAELAVLGELKAPDGVLVTTGNHDYYAEGGAKPWVEYLTELGLTVLNNDAYVVERDGEYLSFVGINDRTGDTPLNPDLQLAWNRLEELNPVAASDSAYQILIAHQPLQALTDDGLPGRLGIDAQLSGHTHGGQIWPIHFLVPLQQPVLDGIHTISGVQVVTSHGAGAWGPPIRVAAAPQIPLVALCSTRVGYPEGSPCA